MKDTYTINKLPYVIAVPIGAATSSVLIAKLPNETYNDLVKGLIFIFVFYVTSRILEAIISYLIRKNVWLRKLILGVDFIEGWWIEKINKIHREVGDTELEGGDFTVVQIFFDDGAYKIQGHLLSGSGTLKGSFYSGFSYYAEGKLQYVFEGPWLNSDKPYTNNGFARLNFTRDINNKSPNFFEGEVINIGPDFNRTFFSGEKVDKEKLSKLKITNISEFALKIKEIS